MAQQALGSPSGRPGGYPHQSARGRQRWRCQPVGHGVSELRIDYGPGYRLYYLREADRLILLLTGGDKSSQDADIRTAHHLAREWRTQEGPRT